MNSRATKWSEAEIATMRRLRQEGTVHRVIAARLGRTPTSVQICYAQTCLVPERPSTRWTRAEDDKLISLQRSGRDWPAVIAALPGRSKMAAQKRWHNILRPSLDAGDEPVRSIRRHPWTDDDLRQLLHLRNDLKLSYREIHERMPAWKAATLYSKYYKLTTERSPMGPKLNQKAWTKDEDDRVRQLRAASKPWSHAYEALPHRSPSAIMNRWYHRLQYSRYTEAEEGQ